MKAKLCLFIIILSLFLLVGCAQEEQKKCVICGGVADYNLSGPYSQMEAYGISMSDCRQIASEIYSTSVCSSCVPVSDPYGLPY